MLFQQKPKALGGFFTPWEEQGGGRGHECSQAEKGSRTQAERLVASAKERSSWFDPFFFIYPLSEKLEAMHEASDEEDEMVELAAWEVSRTRSNNSVPEC